MSERSVEHATFVVERRYEVSPERAFAAWADPEAKARWYTDSDAHLELDFRVGGRERHSGSAPDGRAYRYEAHFHDIVPAQRIVYAYEMLLEGTRISVSLATVEFTPTGESGSDMVFTEQGAFLDGRESAAGRAQGMGSLWTPWERSFRARPVAAERHPAGHRSPRGLVHRSTATQGLACPGVLHSRQTRRLPGTPLASASDEDRAHDRGPGPRLVPPGEARA